MKYEYKLYGNNYSEWDGETLHVYHYNRKTCREVVTAKGLEITIYAWSDKHTARSLLKCKKPWAKRSPYTEIPTNDPNFQEYLKSIPEVKYLVNKVLQDASFYALERLGAIFRVAALKETEGLFTVLSARYDTNSWEKEVNFLHVICRHDWENATEEERVKFLRFLSKCDEDQLRGFTVWCSCTKDSISKMLQIKDTLVWKYQAQVHAHWRARAYMQAAVTPTDADIRWLIRTEGVQEWQAVRERLGEFTDFLVEQYERIPEYRDRNAAIQDPYWRRPRNWFEIHHQATAERRANAEGEYAELLRIREEEAKETVSERYAQYQNKVLQKEGLKCFASSDWDEWCKQADTLHQCICYGEYWKKRTSVILFVTTEEGQPVSTHEANLKTKKIIQEYADELIRETMTPPENATALAKAWIEAYL